MRMFYKGYEVSQVECFGPLTMIRVVKSLAQGLSGLDYGTDLCVSTDQLQPLVSDMYSIGDKVTSVLRQMEWVGTHSNAPWSTTNEYRQGRKFEGIVTGYEHDTNRVVCRGYNVDDGTSRKRYSYGVNEVIKEEVLVVPEVDLTFTFEPGSRYKLNQRTVVLATETSKTGFVALYNMANGECLHKQVPITAFKPTLAVKQGIKNIQKMR